MKLRICTGPDVWHEAEGQLLGILEVGLPPHLAIEARHPNAPVEIRYTTNGPGVAGGGVELLEATDEERAALKAAGFTQLKGL